MKRFAIALVTAAALLGAPAAMAKPKLTGEAKLAKMLEGYEAGQPVDCISVAQTRDMRVIDKTAIVYRSGRTLYVNRPTNADRLDDNDILVTDLHTSQLCSIDTVRLHDRSGFFYSGFVGLEKFVPYRKIAVND